MAEAPHKPVWWTISEERLLDLLRRCHGGEDPEEVYLEEYANAEITDVPGDDDGDDDGRR